MSGLVELLGDKLLSRDGEIDTSSLKFEKDEVLGLYFSAHWCPPCRMFTPKLVEFYKNLNKSGSKMKIVFVSSDRDQAGFDEYYNEMPWYALPYSEREKKKPIAELLSGKVVDKEGNESTIEELRNGGYTIGIYFSAHWCPPCRAFTPQLVETYKKVQQKGHKFEIVFVSSDRDETAFKEYLDTMPWKALPLGDGRKASLNKRFEVDGIPTLVILDCEGNSITSDGHSRITSDKNGDEFPWRPKPVNSLSEATGLLNEYPIVMLFADGSDEDVKEIGKNLLLPVAEKLGDVALPGNDATELLFVLAGGDNDADLCNRVRQFAKLPKAEENPSLLTILNIPEGEVYVHEGKVEAASDIQAVVDDFKAKELTFRNLQP